MEEIILNNEKYELIHNKNGTDTLRQYNPKYKMWINMNYDPKSTYDPTIKVVEILSKQFIERVTGVIIMHKD